ncbi:Crinkler (CRN) family protein [Phytophthora cinnamomi]|uniref:Crinkler (CRN) family protein n=1 Tax=Phytophthora cinnamomi TaxID=4785 RepID=UPI002B2AFE2D|nr:Crinkler (CRN) family protein [Phytophthora cinnamomi]WNO07205.1 CRN effector protein [Phytophthora cinnamomi]
MYFDADNLQLFLAKTAGGAWLDGVGAAAVTLDEDGHLQGFEQMDPTLFINNDKHFGKNFGPAEGEVHVLVVAPERAVGSASETSKLDRLVEKVDKMYEQTVLTKRKRYAYSEMNSSKGKQLLEDLNIQVFPVRTVPVDVGRGNPVNGFQWMSVECGQQIHDLSEEQQRRRYHKYVEDNIGDVLKEQQLCVIGVEKSEKVLTKEVPGCNIELAGSTDLLVLSDIAVANPSSVKYLPGVKMLIEVKRAVQNGCALIQTATIANPGEAFEVIRKLLAQSPIAGTEIELPYIQNPVKRLKLKSMLPSIGEGESGGIRESIERYYDIASMLGPDWDMARAVARQVTRSIPTLSYFS